MALSSSSSPSITSSTLKDKSYTASFISLHSSLSVTQNYYNSWYKWSSRLSCFRTWWVSTERRKDKMGRWKPISCFYWSVQAVLQSGPHRYEHYRVNWVSYTIWRCGMIGVGLWLGGSIMPLWNLAISKFGSSLQSWLLMNGYALCISGTVWNGLAVLCARNRPPTLFNSYKIFCILMRRDINSFLMRYNTLYRIIR